MTNYELNPPPRLTRLDNAYIQRPGEGDPRLNGVVLPPRPLRQNYNIPTFSSVRRHYGKAVLPPDEITAWRPPSAERARVIRVLDSHTVAGNGYAYFFDGAATMVQVLFNLVFQCRAVPSVSGITGILWARENNANIDSSIAASLMELRHIFGNLINAFVEPAFVTSEDRIGRQRAGRVALREEVVLAYGMAPEERALLRPLQFDRSVFGRPGTADAGRSGSPKRPQRPTSAFRLDLARTDEEVGASGLMAPRLFPAAHGNPSSKVSQNESDSAAAQNERDSTAAQHERDSTAASTAAQDKPDPKEPWLGSGYYEPDPSSFVAPAEKLLPVAMLARALGRSVYEVLEGAAELNGALPVLVETDNGGPRPHLPAEVLNQLSFALRHQVSPPLAAISSQKRPCGKECEIFD